MGPGDSKAGVGLLVCRAGSPFGWLQSVDGSQGWCWLMVGWIYLLDPLVKKARSLDLRGFQRGYSGLLVASIVYSLKLGAWPGGVSGLMPTSWWAGHDLGLIRGFQNASCQHPCPHGRTISPKWLLSVSFLR